MRRCRPFGRTLSNTGIVRLDVALVDAPGQRLGRAVAGIADQLARPDAEIVVDPLDHPLCRGHLGLPDRG